ncbi:hypothetical protein BMW23_0719 [Bodo saltans virus]|uniref:Uncharacterized protein n=1 Tax=Bodo saltans virus TaxID=2024608 RepID=A0A2H4UVA9_9VIRU|nr:hypothetical protein QJ851_gp0702 [Bodo saltans virus]ATZ80765.1 hypothetical protein BMW23_0719 [Bodo saltans virus]
MQTKILPALSRQRCAFIDFPQCSKVVATTIGSLVSPYICTFSQLKFRI